MRGSHAAGGMPVHHIGPAGARGQWQRTGNALSETSNIRHDAVVFEAPQRATSPEAGLHFIANQQGLASRTPLTQGLHVFGWSKGGAPPLVGLENSARHMLRLDAFLSQTAFEEFK